MLAVAELAASSEQNKLETQLALFLQCEIIGGQPQEGIETNAVEFFAENELPSLSIARNTESQIKLAFKHLHNPQEPTYFD